MKILFLLIVTTFCFISCNNSTSPNLNISLTFNQIPGCNNGLLSKVGNNSTFTYLFNSTLKINLKLPANCCPDEDRFNQVSTINNNIITITIIDKAANLCDCICDYEVEISLNNLPDDEYTFICNYSDSIYYNEKVIRTF